MSDPGRDTNDATGDGTGDVPTGNEATELDVDAGTADAAADTGARAGAGAAAPPAPAPVSLDAVAAVARPFRLQFEEAQDAWVLLYPEGMVKLNRSAGETLARCDGERPVAEVVAALEKAFGQSGLGGDVCGFLGVAHAQGWVSLR